MLSPIISKFIFENEESTEPTACEIRGSHMFALSNQFKALFLIHYLYSSYIPETQSVVFHNSSFSSLFSFMNASYGQLRLSSILSNDYYESLDLHTATLNEINMALDYLESIYFNIKDFMYYDLLDLKQYNKSYTNYFMQLMHQYYQYIHYYFGISHSIHLFRYIQFINHEDNKKLYVSAYIFVLSKMRDKYLMDELSGFIYPYYGISSSDQSNDKTMGEIKEALSILLTLHLQYNYDGIFDAQHNKLNQQELATIESFYKNLCKIYKALFMLKKKKKSKSVMIPIQKEAIRAYFKSLEEKGYKLTKEQVEELHKDLSRYAVDQHSVETLYSFIDRLENYFYMSINNRITESIQQYSTMQSPTMDEPNDSQKRVSAEENSEDDFQAKRKRQGSVQLSALQNALAESIANNPSMDEILNAALSDEQFATSTRSQQDELVVRLFRDYVNHHVINLDSDSDELLYSDDAESSDSSMANRDESETSSNDQFDSNPSLNSLYTLLKLIIPSKHYQYFYAFLQNIDCQYLSMSKESQQSLLSFISYYYLKNGKKDEEAHNRIMNMNCHDIEELIKFIRSVHPIFMHYLLERKLYLMDVKKNGYVSNIKTIHNSTFGNTSPNDIHNDPPDIMNMKPNDSNNTNEFFYFNQDHDFIIEQESSEEEEENSYDSDVLDLSELSSSEESSSESSSLPAPYSIIMYNNSEEEEEEEEEDSIHASSSSNSILDYEDYARTKNDDRDIVDEDIKENSDDLKEENEEEDYSEDIEMSSGEETSSVDVIDNYDQVSLSSDDMDLSPVNNDPLSAISDTESVQSIKLTQQEYKKMNDQYASQSSNDFLAVMKSTLARGKTLYSFGKSFHLITKETDQMIQPIFPYIESEMKKIESEKAKEVKNKDNNKKELFTHSDKHIFILYNSEQFRQLISIMVNCHHECMLKNLFVIVVDYFRGDVDITNKYMFEEMIKFLYSYPLLVKHSSMFLITVHLMEYPRGKHLWKCQLHPTSDSSTILHSSYRSTSDPLQSIYLLLRLYKLFPLPLSYRSGTSQIQPPNEIHAYNKKCSFYCIDGFIGELYSRLMKETQQYMSSAHAYNVRHAYVPYKLRFDQLLAQHNVCNQEGVYV